MESYQQEAMQLIEQQQAVMIASQYQQQPLCSYSPFIYKEGYFYCLLSSLAEHHAILCQQARASLLIIEDEAKAKQIYARKRLSIEVKAERLKLEDSAEILTLLEQRHGEVVQVLSQLNDFDVFRFSPSDKPVRFIRGFGQAYEVTLT